MGAILVLQDNNPRIINADGETSLRQRLCRIAGRKNLPSFRDYSFYKDRQGESGWVRTEDYSSWTKNIDFPSVQTGLIGL